MNKYFIGSISKELASDFEYIKIIHTKDLENCQKGNFLIGSLNRNKKFDDSRCDKGEATVSIKWKNQNKEQWFLEGDELKFLGLKATENFSGMKGRGDLGIENMSLFNGNLLSLSLSVINKVQSEERKSIKIKEIIESIGFKEEVTILKIKNPIIFFELITNKISTKLNEKLIPIFGKINYGDRIIINKSLALFKKDMNDIFFSKTLHFDYLFRKPEQYKKDKEFRLFWLKHFEDSLQVDYQNLEYLILNGIDFQENFEVLKIK